jgi:hypothetical protein
VLHAWRHEQADPVVLLGAHLRQHARVVVDRVAGGDRGVVPAVIQQELATARLERRSADGVDDGTDLLVQPSDPVDVEDQDQLAF